MSTLRVNNLTAVGGTGTITVPTGNQVVQTGAILQVVQSVKTDTFTHASNAWADVTGMSVSITPSSASNKILVMFNCHMATTSSTTGSVKLLRGSTDIFIGDAAGSRTRSTQIMYDTFGIPATGIYLDSPATTSSTTYKIQFRANDNASAVYLNRTATDTDSALYNRCASSITVMEVAG